MYTLPSYTIVITPKACKMWGMLFLNEKLHEEVYIPPLPRWSVSSHLVNQLKKALYELKQVDCR